jgi:hypothetical protein
MTRKNEIETHTSRHHTMPGKNAAAGAENKINKITFTISENNAG